MAVSPAASSFSNGVLGPHGDAQAGADHQQEGQQHGGGAEQPELLADGGEDEVGRHRGDALRVPWRQAGAGQAAGGEGEHGLDDLVAGAVGDRPRVEPDVDPVLHVGERLPREGGAGAEQHAPDARGTRSGRWPPRAWRRTGRRTAATSPRSFSAEHDDEREAPRQHDRPEVAELGELAQAARRNPGQQLLLLDQVGGEEHAEDDLGQLAGLEGHRRRAAPTAGRR